jgi:hypothetical protein
LVLEQVWGLAQSGVKRRLYGLLHW